MSIEVKCIIANEDSEWQEVLDAESLETAETDVKAIIDMFNATLRPNEKPRHLVRIIKELTPEEKTRADKIKDFHAFLTDLRHEYSNAFGNVWLKDKFPLFMKAYETLLETGKSRMLNKYVWEILQNVRDVPDRLKYLKDEDIVALFKEGKE